MAAQQTLNAQIQPSDQSSFLDRFVHVNRAGRFKPTHRGEQRRDVPLIPAQQCEHNALHWRHPGATHTLRPSLWPPATQPSKGLSCGSKEILSQQAVSCSGATLPRIHHKVKAFRDFSVRSAKNLPEQAFDAVPDHGIPDFARDRDSKAMVAKFVLPAEEHKPPSLRPPPLMVYGTIVGAPHDSEVPRKSLRMRAIHSPSAFCVPWPGGVSVPGDRPLSPCGP